MAAGRPELRVYYYGTAWYEVRKPLDGIGDVSAYYREVEEWCLHHATQRWNLAVSGRMHLLLGWPSDWPRELLMYFENKLDAAKFTLLF